MSIEPHFLKQMHSNIHRNPVESAGIVDTALYVESEGRGFESNQRILFSYFFAPRPEYCSKHQKCYVFITIIFSSCCIKVKRLFHETYAPVICNHGPQNWGRAGDSRASEPFFFYFYIEFDELEHTRLREKTAMV